MGKPCRAGRTYPPHAPMTTPYTGTVVPADNFVNTVAEGDSIAVTVSGANTQNPSSAQVVVVIRRSA